ncbi:N-6 DNA methylase [Streptomyces sp. BG9H]|uniref:site-specific DNA-methyltransferase (adenine-specific) n=1 Tax=Streptomyces anatolicus TaxID=2675858 RepID=A0ABS6YS08_9ACTN|nr:N-6 DNA methylase [Streptomyces anatolicus]MBW5423789.1 N-6 DNA methylase [Streptomyces anatolicus]
MTDLGLLLVTRADIARLAGVRRPAVTNWERRHGDFPEPESSSSPTGTDVFRADEVAAWLDRRTVPANVRRDEELAGTTFGDRFRGALGGGDFSAREFVRRLTTEVDRFRGELRADEHMLLLLALVHVWGDVPGARASVPLLRTALRAALNRDIGNREQLAALAEVFGRQGPRTRPECAAVFDLLVDRYRNEFGQRAGSEFFTPKSVARTMARLLVASRTRVSRIHDPFCRAGEALAAVLAELPDSQVSPRVTGTTPSEAALRLATMNLSLHGVRGAEFHLGMETESPTGASPWPGAADWIVTNPPFGQKLPAPEQEQRTWRYASPGSRGDFAWLQHVVDQLAPGGKAAVVMPQGAGFSGGRAGQIRGAMIQDGVVECVVALPSQLFASTGIPVDIWILTGAEARREEVLFVDGSELGSMTGRALRELSEDETDAMVDAYTAWKHGTERRESAQPGAVSVPSRALSFEELRSHDYLLTPRSLTVSQHTLANPDVPEHVLATRAARLESAAERLRTLDDRLERFRTAWRQNWARTAVGNSRPSALSDWRQERLGDLAEVMVGPGGQRRDSLSGGEQGVPMVRPADVRGQRIRHDGTTRVPEREAESLKRYTLRAGDLVMTRTGTVGRCALVTEAEEGWLFGTHLVRLRPHEPSHSAYLLGFLARPDAQRWINQRARGTAVQSVSAKELHELPVLLPPVEERREIGLMLSTLDEQRQAHTELVAALDVYRAELADLLMSGWVSPPVRN